MENPFIMKIFDVSQGSCNFIISPTGKTELIDFGTETDWSPVCHIFKKYIPSIGSLNRLVLTHHHGDHLRDWANLKKNIINLVVRRKLTGQYAAACQNSNSPYGQNIAKEFDEYFRNYNHKPDASEISHKSWGFSVSTWCLSNDQANKVSTSYNSLVNNSSFVRLYSHNGNKILLAGDMEKEGMELLLSTNDDFIDAVGDLNILIAPHHGHKSGFCTKLMQAIGKPDIVIASMKRGDKHVDTRYSCEDYVNGLLFNDGSKKRLLTTRVNGAITINSIGQGNFIIETQTR